MNGSEKQIKWAEDIKASKMERFNLMREHGNEMGVKAIDFILNQPNASFWIDYRLNSPDEMIRKLCTTGLEIYGGSFSHSAVLDPRTGVVTITRDELIQDGKGGHIEKRSEVINL